MDRVYSEARVIIVGITYIKEAGIFVLSGVSGLFEEVVINNSHFLVDKNATFHYKAKYNTPCDCVTCKNYYQVIQAYQPVLQYAHSTNKNICRSESFIWI